MPKQDGIHKVLIIGSGPIVIGQGAEFDYSGTQACHVLKSEGIEVVLLNNNPATIMTDADTANRVYMEPLTIETVVKILEIEKPDAILAGMGGQTALNLAMTLHESGILSSYGVELLGTDADAILKAESRESFKKLMDEIGEPSVESGIAHSLEEVKTIADEIGYPVVVRPAFTLGGTGGGIAENEMALMAVAQRGLSYSATGQVLIEKSIKGWKEIEYEMMRDAAGNAITVCNMENIDPVGIHTGDSIVVAPSQTLSDHDYQMLRRASIHIVDALNIKGGCNVQMALDPKSSAYRIIEVNPRVSRSSALASKATGYPIAKVAAKIALGYTLDEIENEVTGVTTACFEPALDYCVVKMPKFPFEKFREAKGELGTMMMATGEVMAIGNRFEVALLKAVRSLESGIETLKTPLAQNKTLDELFLAIEKADDFRLFYLAELLRRGVSEVKLNTDTGIDLFFIHKISEIVKMEQWLYGKNYAYLRYEEMAMLKKMGFSDAGISELTLFATPQKVTAHRIDLGVLPSYKMVDTCSAEFIAQTPYYYSVYGLEDEVQISTQKKMLVIGSGPIRIGQGVEFDYCTVRGIMSLKEKGYETIVINNNPETVSTDFNISDKLYFEPITLEDVMNVIGKEKPEAVILQFGGQTALKLAASLEENGVKILGTEAMALHLAEDREAFAKLAIQLNVPCPEGSGVYTVADGLAVAEKIGYPLMVRPSFVLGGLGMKVVKDSAEAEDYLKNAFLLDGVKTVLVDKFIEGIECEIDAISDGNTILIPGIMEHLEGAGVHSGDSIAHYPTVNLTQAHKEQIVKYTEILSKAMAIKGLLNIQFIISGEKVYVLEVNPRSSRTIPFLSKVTGVPMIDVAINVMLGKALKDLGYGEGLMGERSRFYFKLPIFSHAKIPNLDVRLGPEMKSTGEILSVSDNFEEGLYKGILAAHSGFGQIKRILLDGSIKQGKMLKDLHQALSNWGFESYVLAKNGVELKGLMIEKIQALFSEEAKEKIRKGDIQLLISLYDSWEKEDISSREIRRLAVDHRCLCLTNGDVAKQVVGLLLCPKPNYQIYDLSLEMTSPVC